MLNDRKLANDDIVPAVIGYERMPKQVRQEVRLVVMMTAQKTG